MVVFTCQHCGESVKKPAVEKHYFTKCRSRSPYLTCVDCLKDFGSDTYVSHNQCVTEAERYSAHGTVIKEQKGRKKQEQYVQMIHEILNSKDLKLSNIQRKLLELCSKYENVPRKLPRFENFFKNAVKVDLKWTQKDIHSVFNVIEEAWKKQTEESTGKEPVSQGKRTSDLVDETKSNGTPNLKNRKKNENAANNEENHKNSDGEEVAVSKDVHMDEIKENIDKVSKKKLKKQKKYEKYLAELDNESKTVVNEIPLESDENDDNKKKKKKSKKSKIDESEPKLLGFNEDRNADNLNNTTTIAGSEQTKKRKLKECADDTPEKRIKKTSDEGQEEESAGTVFNWGEVIMKVLQSQSDKELSLKKLGKKVVKEYQTVNKDHRTYEELLAKFNKKVNKTKGVRVLKDKAKLIE